jgi:hypothetical protein
MPISRNSKFLLQRSRKAPIKLAWIDASAASVEGSISNGRLAALEPLSAIERLHFDSAAGPVRLTLAAADGLRPPLSYVR